MIRVVHIDPYPIVRKGLKGFLKHSEDFKLVASSAKFKEGIAYITQNSCDILLTEMTLEVGPIKIIKDVLEQSPETKIIIFSSQPQNMYAVSLLKAGATAFLHKNIERNVLLDALRQVHKLGFPLTGAHAHINYNINLEQPRNLYEKLSSREAEVMRLVIDGYRNKAIAEKLGINQKTAATYKKRVFQKFNVENVTDLYQLNRSFKLVK